MKGFGQSSGGPQQRRELLDQLLYLGRESGDSGSCLRAPGFNERSCTCLGEGAGRGRVKNLLFRGDYGTAKMSEKINAKERRSYSCYNSKKSNSKF
jgi:hypothetical protein